MDRAAARIPIDFNGTAMRRAETAAWNEFRV